MKKIITRILTAAAILAASLSASQAQTNILAGWSFDNLSLGANSAPAASTNSGTASVVNLTSPAVVGLPGSSTGSVIGTNAWEAAGGWSTNNGIGFQGVQFAASTYGFYGVQFSFDVYAKTNAEAYLLVQYTPDGISWRNANITSAGSLGVLATNAITTNGIVVGTYLVLTNNGGVAAWNNGVKVDLTGNPWVDNNPNFAIRFVNAATGTNCLDTTGSAYKNTSGGDWAFDNVVIQGVPFDTAVDWTFDGVGQFTINNPGAAISNTTATATCIGFNLTNTLFGTVASGKNISTNAADIAANGVPYSSTGAAGQNVWRLRGQPGNGWLSLQPIGSQGAEFDVDTTGYTNIMLSFDLYFTTQGEAKMCVEYTTNNVGGVWGSTNVANNLAYAAGPQFIMTNTPTVVSPDLSQGGNQTTFMPNTVNGTLFFNNFGSIFFNNCIVDFTGVPGVAGNPQFAFRIVNAATGGDCVNYLYQPYNNNSGNCRLDNVALNGKFVGNIAPAVSPAPSATVDHPFTNTFAFNPGWSSSISSIVVNGIVLPASSYAVTSSNIVFTPSTNAPVLAVAGTDYIIIYANGYTSAKVTQVVGTGAFVGLFFVQPAGPSASGGTLTVNPNFTCVDQFNNPTTNTYPNMQVVATVSNSPATWTLGGSVTQAIYNGNCTFTDLTATVTGSAAISNAAITFTVTAGPIAITNSLPFIIGKPPIPFTLGNLAVLQADTAGNNSTFSIIEVKPSAAGQTNPVNIVPITATGTNALRMCNAGSGGHLTLSDDGTRLVFAAYVDGSSATADETFNLNRAVGTLDYTNGYGLHAKYVSNSYGGSQARAACSPDNNNFLIDDKGGLYIAPTGTNYNLYQQNNISTKSFGGVCWVQTAKVASPPTPSVFIFSDGNNASGVGLNYTDDPRYGNPDSVFNVGNGTPPTDSFAQDFYMISAYGTNFLYTLDQSVQAGVGVINKWSMNSDFSWNSLGSWTNADNGGHVFATTNGSGGAYIFYVNGKNSIIRLTDLAVGGNLNIKSTNTIYTATTGNIQGLVFVPQPNGYATELMPPPILTGISLYSTNKLLPIVITCTPDDGTWRSNITAITVNGTPLSTAAYATNSAGKITFYPSNSVALQTPGFANIAISATGYSTNSIIQPIGGLPTQLVITTQPTSPAADGGSLAKQPVLVEQDINGITVTNPTFSVTASVGGSGSWTLGGNATIAMSASKGTVTYTNLTAFNATALTTATIHFTSGSLTSVDSTPAFSIPAPILSKLGGVNVTASGNYLTFSFTNATGLSFSVLATNNITIPVGTWPKVGSAVEGPAGTYQFTNSTPATNSQLYYILRQP